MNNNRSFKIFVISLAHATERRSSISERLATAGVSYEIVDAVDGKSLDMDSTKPRLIDDLIKLRGLPRTTDGAIGYFLSHYNLWSRMIREQTPYALILEDDVVWQDGFFSVVQAVVDSKWYWNIVHLSHPDPGKIESVIDQVGNCNLVRFRYAQACTDAYLIDLDGAKKMYDYCYYIRDNIDEQWKFYWKSGCYFYHVTPAPARQDNSPSFINHPKTDGTSKRNQLYVTENQFSIQYLSTHTNTVDEALYETLSIGGVDCYADELVEPDASSVAFGTTPQCDLSDLAAGAYSAQVEVADRAGNSEVFITDKKLVPDTTAPRISVFKDTQDTMSNKIRASVSDINPPSTPTVFIQYKISASDTCDQVGFSDSSLTPYDPNPENADDRFLDVDALPSGSVYCFVAIDLAGHQATRSSVNPITALLLKLRVFLESALP